MKYECHFIAGTPGVWASLFLILERDYIENTIDLECERIAKKLGWTFSYKEKKNEL